MALAYIVYRGDSKKIDGFGLIKAVQDSYCWDSVLVGGEYGWTLFCMPGSLPWRCPCLLSGGM